MASASRVAPAITIPATAPPETPKPSQSRRTLVAHSSEDLSEDLLLLSCL